MTKKLGFEMTLVDIFHLQDGRTVFAGSIQNSEQRIKHYIKRCQVELIIDRKVQTIITIDGEMIPDRKHPEGLSILDFGF
jgi:hypothetical protein